MLRTMLIISLSMSALIVLLLLLSPLFDKRYSARWRYFVWLLISVRLLIPLNLAFPAAPIQIPAVDRAVVINSENTVPLKITEITEYNEPGNTLNESASPASVIPLINLLTYIWLAGTALFILFHLISYFRFRHVIKKYILPTDNVGVFVCSALQSPLVCGFIRPIILLPEYSYTNSELEFILAHERTHIRRGDLWYKLMLMIANAVHWFNPFVYLMVRRANRDLEYSCDYLVVKEQDLDYRKNYSLTILKYIRRNVK